jgi:hypothetical protein
MGHRNQPALPLVAVLKTRSDAPFKRPPYLIASSSTSKTSGPVGVPGRLGLSP